MVPPESEKKHLFIHLVEKRVENLHLYKALSEGYQFGG